MLTILFANHKGGCGKTTLAHHLAEHLAEQEFRVLVLDADSQANLYRRLARLDHKPTECPVVTWSPGCACALSPGAWAMPKHAKRNYDVVIIDTSPGEKLPEGPAPDVVVVPIDGLDSALGAGNLVDAIFDDGMQPLIMLVKNGTDEGGRKLQRAVTDLEDADGIEVCKVEVIRGAAIHRTQKTCRPAWHDVYKGSRDVKTMLACCQWLAKRLFEQEEE